MPPTQGYFWDKGFSVSLFYPRNEEVHLPNTLSVLPKILKMVFGALFRPEPVVIAGFVPLP
jgi:hypothetical protein